MEPQTVDVEALSALSQARLSLPRPRDRRSIRQRAKVSQAEVARVVGVSRTAVTRWEAGDRDPTGPRLRAYMQVLDRLSDAP